MIKKKMLFVVLAISLSLVSCKTKEQNAGRLSAQESRSARPNTVPDIAENDVRLHIGALASDSMRGRRSASPYELKAAEYIREQFKSLGLKSFYDDYFQTVPIGSRTYFNNCTFLFDGYTGVFPTDFRPVYVFDSLTVTGRVVFAGYGLDADYADIDVKNKWALIAEDNNSMLFDRKMTAKKNGASGVLVIGLDGTTGSDRTSMPPDSAPMIKISHNLTDRLLARANTTVQDVLSNLKAGEKQRITIPVTVSATIKTAIERTISQNVVAFLETPDSGSEDMYIVIGAHHDHVGTRVAGDSLQIFYGADDNASGVAGVLELAEKLKTEKKLKYKFIFAAFGAEEMGLVGSRYFCNNPPVPLDKIKLMVNLDMIGRMDANNRVLINTITSTNRFDAVMDAVKNSHPDIKVSFAMENYLQGSDHSSFFSKNIPVLSFTTGLHSEYHTPSDTIGAINFKGQKMLLDYVYDIIIKSE